MMRASIRWAIAAAVSVPLGSFVLAQGLELDAVVMHLAVEDGTLRDGVHWVYQEPERIELRLELSNRSDATLWANDGVVRRAGVQVSLIDESAGTVSDVPVRADWRGIIEQDLQAANVPAIPVPTLPDLLVTLDDRRTVTWVVSVGQADGSPFTAGRYRIQLTLSHMRSALRTWDGEAWHGPVPSERSVELVVVAPSTAEEWAWHYQQRAEAAERRHRWEEALAAYMQVSVIHPSLPLAGVQDAGRMYMRLGRYEEAIAALRRLRPDGITLLLLAGSYVGVGDEASAATALRSTGLPEELVQAELARQRKLWGSHRDR